MALDREIDALRRRLNKIVPMVSPPEFKLHVIGASEPVPAHTAWALVIKIEDKTPLSRDEIADSRR